MIITKQKLTSYTRTYIYIYIYSITSYFLHFIMFQELIAGIDLDRILKNKLFTQMAAFQ